MLRSIVFFTTLASLFLIVKPGHAGVPLQIEQSGRLTTASGTPVNGTLVFTFTLYDESTGGKKLWQKTTDVRLNDGYFTIDLSVDPAAIQPAPKVFLGVKVGSDAEMTPRRRFKAVPYAAFARNAVGIITPRRVDVGGQVVINTQGQWVGPPIGLPRCSCGACWNTRIVEKGRNACEFIELCTFAGWVETGFNGTCNP